MSTDQLVIDTPRVTSEGFGSSRVTGRLVPARADRTIAFLVWRSSATNPGWYSAWRYVRTDSLGRFRSDLAWNTGYVGELRWVAEYRPTSTTVVRSAPILQVRLPKIVLTSTSVGGSTTQYSRVTGRTEPALPNEYIGFSVWRTTSTNPSWWSFWRNARTRADGTFTMDLAWNKGYVGQLKWQAKLTPSMSPSRTVFSPTITETKVARIDFSTSPVTAAMVPVTYRTGCPVAPSMLTRITMNHWGFDGRIHTGHLIVRSTQVSKFQAGFRAGFIAHFPIRQMKDPSPYRTDEASMETDNSYAFFCRQVVGNPLKLSPHSHGTAVDVNPVENPYLLPDGKTWLPEAGAPYISRSVRRPGMLFSDTTLVSTLRAQGFAWGGLWGYPDIHHFQL